MIRGPSDPSTENRSTARLLAAVITVLLVSFLVVNRSQAAFEAEAGNEDNRFAPGKVELTDDDAGTSLFDVPNLSPGRPVSNCIAVTYRGTVVPASIRLFVRGQGALAPLLDVAVESGRGGRFHDCADFAPEGQLFSGNLTDLVRATAGESEGLAAFTAEDRADSRTFRFTFTLRTEEGAEGAEARADLVWEASTD